MHYLSQEITSFTSSNITETTPAWVVTTPYTAGALVLFGVYVYKAVTAHTGKSPELFEGIYWIKWAISNKYAMLDLSAQSKSVVVGGNLVVEFLQNRIPTITIGNYEAASITVEILDTDGITVLWTYGTVASINVGVTDYYTYMYEPYNYEVDRAIKVDLPLWGYKVRCTFNISPVSTRTACGYLVGGTPIDMGQTLFGVNFGYNSFAIKETDDFGTLSITKRAVQDRVDFETTIDNVTLATMRREIKKIYNDIVVFIVDESSDKYENLLTLGTIESASIVLSNPKVTTMTFSVIEAI